MQPLGMEANRHIPPLYPCSEEDEPKRKILIDEMRQKYKLAVGICADEAHRMTDAYRPLVDAGITKKEARELCEEYGLVNPVYKWRSSCSCFCCPFQKKQDWKNLLEWHPDLYALAESWEEMSILTSPTGFTWNDSFSLKQLREADEAQFRLFPDCRETACAICTW
jgi:hypothetical protein